LNLYHFGLERVKSCPICRGISSIELATSISTRTYFSKENPLTV